MKSFALLLLCFTIPYISIQATLQDDPTQDLQELYNGLFEHVNLNDPTTVVACYDNQTAAVTVSFLGKFFSDLATNQVVQAGVILQQYEESVPQNVNTCLSQNLEIQSMFKAYNIEGQTFGQIATAIIKLVSVHYQEVHTALVDLNDSYTQQDYLESGEIVGRLIQEAYPSELEFKPVILVDGYPW